LYFYSEIFPQKVQIGKNRSKLKNPIPCYYFIQNDKPKLNFQLNFTNKYPFYVNLPTSSKQSRKVSILANAIRAETSFMSVLRDEQKQQFMDVNTNPDSQIGEEKNNQKGQLNGTSFGLSVTNEFGQNEGGQLARRQSSLPPVEVLVEHFRRSSVATGPTAEMMNSSLERRRAIGGGQRGRIQKMMTDKTKTTN
jgi:hypothetical protein